MEGISKGNKLGALKYHKTSEDIRLGDLDYAASFLDTTDA